MTRTDIHRPSSPDFDPEAYTLLGVFDLDPEWPTGDRQRRMEIINAWLAKGYSFAGAPHPTGQCDHCGAHIRYEALTAHAPTRTLIEFGETCLDNRLGHTAESFQALRRAAAERALRTREANRRHEIREAVTEWLSEPGTNPLLVELSYRGNGGTVDGNDFLDDIARKLLEYGYLTERQESATVAAIERAIQWQARDDRRAAETVARQATASPAPSGRVVITGTVLATWVKDTDFGFSTRWRVQTDAGWHALGNVPRALLDDHDADDLRGARVRFTATVSPFDDDPTAAWTTRPTKAAVLDTAELVTA